MREAAETGTENEADGNGRLRQYDVEQQMNCDRLVCCRPPSDCSKASEVSEKVASTEASRQVSKEEKGWSCKDPLKMGAS